MSSSTAQASTEANPNDLLSRCRTLSNRTASYLKRSAAEMDEIGMEVKKLSKSVIEAIQNAKRNGTDDDSMETLLKAERVLKGEGGGGDLRKFKPGKRSPMLLQMMLGKNTQPILMRREESLKMKHDYYQFRLHVGGVMTVVPAVLLVFLRRAQILEATRHSLTLTPAVMCAVHMFLAWMLYAYVALALRENVLKLNGSDIRPWWIHHHYWSIVSTLLLLTLPVDSKAVNSFLGKLLFWLSCQGLVLLMQNHFQRTRLYTRIALGKNHEMDVVGGESTGGQGQMYILYPFLFGLQAMQFTLGAEIIATNYMSILDSSGYLDMEPHDADLRGSRGVFYCGAMFFMMSICNFKHTVITIMEKRKHARHRKSQAAKSA